MRCEKCGAEVDAKSLFCPQCGNQLTAAAANEAPAEPTAGDRFRQAVMSRQRGADTEQPLWEGSYSPKAMIGAWIGGGVATLVALVCGIMFLEGGQWWILSGGLLILWAALALTYLYHRYSVKYTLTSQRFVHERGLLWRIIDRVELIDIDDVTCAQGPIERMLNVGTVQITSTDRTHPTLLLPGIDGAREIASTIDDKRRDERRRRAIYTEQV